MNNSSTLRASKSTASNWRFGIPAATPLRDLPTELGEFDVRYALIENESGLIGGIVDLQRVCELLNVDNPIERARWSDVAVGSIAEVLVPCGGDMERPDNSFEQPAITTVRDEIGTAAVVVDGETFVNWNRVNAVFRQNHLDPVTEIPGRQAFNRRLREEVARAIRSEQPLAVMLIDLDHFKEVNDRHGHRTGDALLWTVAEGLRRAIRSYDFVARIGGDEFAVLCNCCGPETVSLPVARLRESLNLQLSQFTPSEINVTASIGVAIATRIDESCCGEAIVEQADTCLYHAKRGGRATTFFVDLDPFARPKFAPIELGRKS